MVIPVSTNVIIYAISGIASITKCFKKAMMRKVHTYVEAEDEMIL